VNPNIQKARRLIGAVSLENVRLVYESALTKVNRLQLTEGMRPRFQTSAKSIGGLTEESTFSVLSSIELEVAEDSQPPVVTMKARYELEYSVLPDFKATKSELRAFAEVNGTFNAWPYFREFVQSTSLRMDMPPIILPVYRVPQPSKETTPSTTPPSSKASE
jgi:hypothetical protein